MLDVTTGRGAANDMAARVASDRREGAERVVAFLCECVDPSCTAFLYLTLGEFTTLRGAHGPLTVAGHAGALAPRQS